VIELNEGEMLADKFWLNPDSKMIWVADNHIKTLVENPVLFEYDGREGLEKQLRFYHALFGTDSVKYKDAESFYAIANEKVYTDQLTIFEFFVYDKGFVWCEYSDGVLTLRSNSLNFLKEGLDDLKEHLHEIHTVHLITVLMDGRMIRHRLIGDNEIKVFLNEMILPRKPKYIEQVKIIDPIKLEKKNNKIADFFVKIINKVYAKKTKTN
jgi:hypothetical protein